MTTTTDWSDLDDSSSFTGSIWSSSTVPGPGAIAGKFLKTLGEKSLDLVVIVIIRRRLAAIQRMLEKSPNVLCSPIGDKEFKRMIEAYKDLHELCRESRSAYYPLSLQRTAANLIRDITVITRSVTANMNIINASPTNGRWEALLTRVQRREELLWQWQPTIVGSTEGDSISHHDPDLPESPTQGSDIKVGVKVEVDYSDQSPVGNPRNPTIDTLLGRIFKSRTLDGSDLRPLDSTRKILVLGGGGVGKSTLVNQIQASLDGSSFSRGATYDQEVMMSYQEVMINNMWQSMRNVLLNMKPSDIKSFDAIPLFEFICDSRHYVHHPMCAKCHTMTDAIKTLWRDPAVRRCAREVKLGMQYGPELDSADYFFDSVLRISDPNYQPTFEDVVRCRVRTTGIHPYNLSFNQSPWLVVDTGGERSERKKWVHCFENVTAVIFVVALSDYNATLYENQDVNRMQESLVLFQSIASSRWFTKARIFLLFNKTDIFAEKLESVPLKDCFVDYTGKCFFDACQYFEGQFLSLLEDKSRPVVVNYGCAINVEETRAIIRSIVDEINRH